MKLSPEQVAEACGAVIVAKGEPGFPRRATIDSGESGAGDLFFGLRGERVDGGEFAADAIGAGAWGIVVDPRHAEGLGGGWVFAAPDPLAALQALAAAWRGALGARVVGVTGSVGKTSVKDIARTLLPGRVHANRENLNTEIGLPLTLLEAPDDTDVLVLEMAMRGAGQIAELAAIAAPEIAVITNVGPVHVELLGSVEAIAAAKAEVLATRPRAGWWRASRRRSCEHLAAVSASISPSPRRTTWKTRWPPWRSGWRSARRLTRWPIALRT